MDIKWSDYITNNKVCARAGSSEMRIILTRRQLRWAGHVVRMDEGRLPKQVLYGQLTNGTRNRGLVIGSKTLKGKAMQRKCWATGAPAFGPSIDDSTTRTDNLLIWALEETSRQTNIYLLLFP